MTSLYHAFFIWHFMLWWCSIHCMTFHFKCCMPSENAWWMFQYSPLNLTLFLWNMRTLQCFLWIFIEWMYAHNIKKMIDDEEWLSLVSGSTWSLHATIDSYDSLCGVSLEHINWVIIYEWYSFHTFLLVHVPHILPISSTHLLKLIPKLIMSLVIEKHVKLNCFKLN